MDANMYQIEVNMHHMQANRHHVKHSAQFSLVTSFLSNNDVTSLYFCYWSFFHFSILANKLCTARY